MMCRTRTAGRSRCTRRPVGSSETPSRRSRRRWPVWADRSFRGSALTDLSSAGTGESAGLLERVLDLLRDPAAVGDGVAVGAGPLADLLQAVSAAARGLLRSRAPAALAGGTCLRDERVEGGGELVAVLGRKVDLVGLPLIGECDGSAGTIGDDG